MTVGQHMRSVVVLLVCVVLATAGCTPNRPVEPAPPPPPAGWPAELADFTFVWTAEPAVNLVPDGAAIAVRAYVESYYLAVITEDAKYLYPGFASAVEPDKPGRGTSDLHPQLGDSDPAVWIGTARHHVVSVVHSDRDVTVSACAYLFGTARKSSTSDGYAANVGNDYDINSGIFPMRIGLRASEKAESELPPQAGPSRTPHDDVFGDWKITSFLFDYLSQPTLWPGKESDLAACIAKAEGPPESRHFIPFETYPRSEFPTLPVTPGWPAEPVS
jgi:hypothetical protein